MLPQMERIYNECVHNLHCCSPAGPVIIDSILYQDLTYLGLPDQPSLNWVTRKDLGKVKAAGVMLITSPIECKFAYKYIDACSSTVSPKCLVFWKWSFTFLVYLQWRDELDCIKRSYLPVVTDYYFLCVVASWHLKMSAIMNLFQTHSIQDKNSTQSARGHSNFPSWQRRAL